MEDKRTKFLRIYANVPEAARNEIVSVIDEKPYTWNTAYFEIKEDTELGKKILKKLESVGII